MYAVLLKLIHKTKQHGIDRFTLSLFNKMRSMISDPHSYYRMQYKVYKKKT